MREADVAMDHSMADDGAVMLSEPSPDVVFLGAGLVPAREWNAAMCSCSVLGVQLNAHVLLARL
jgi:hypothetical protein